VATNLWKSRPGVLAAVSPFADAGWRQRIYLACRWLYAPLYRRGMARGGAWYFTLAERIKGMLLRGTR